MNQRTTWRTRKEHQKIPQIAGNPADAESELDPRRTQNLVRPERGVDLFVRRSHRTLGEDHLAAAADAVAERAQAIGRGRPVPLEAAALATGCRLPIRVQRAFNVPSLCSRAFEVFCAGGSVEPFVPEGPCA
jgi:hypothetical protein